MYLVIGVQRLRESTGISCREKLCREIFQMCLSLSFNKKKFSKCTLQIIIFPKLDKLRLQTEPRPGMANIRIGNKFEFKKLKNNQKIWDL